MPDDTEYRQNAEKASQTGTVPPGESDDTVIPGDALEGSGPRQSTARPHGEAPQAELDAEMEEWEAPLGNQRSGVLAPGTHVGTPAGGTITEKSSGASNWGTAREQNDES
ncbi:MAG: hypothetical protein ACK47B_06220 [Armatimonadota bacterium]